MTKIFCARQNFYVYGQKIFVLLQNYVVHALLHIKYWQLTADFVTKTSFFTKKLHFLIFGLFGPPWSPKLENQTSYSRFQLFTQKIIDFWEKIKYSSTEKFFRPFSNFAIFCLFWPFFGPIGPKLGQIEILSIWLHSNLCCEWYSLKRTKYFSLKMAISHFWAFWPPLSPKKAQRLDFSPSSCFIGYIKLDFMKKLGGQNFTGQKVPLSPSLSVK